MIVRANDGAEFVVAPDQIALVVTHVPEQAELRRFPYQMQMKNDTVILLTQAEALRVAREAEAWLNAQQALAHKQPEGNGAKPSAVQATDGPQMSLSEQAMPGVGHDYYDRFCAAYDPKNSICDSAQLADLNWQVWQVDKDSGDLFVIDGNDKSHRVRPRGLPGYIHVGLQSICGRPNWVYGHPEAPWKKKPAPEGQYAEYNPFDQIPEPPCDLEGAHRVTQAEPLLHTEVLIWGPPPAGDHTEARAVATGARVPIEYAWFAARRIDEYSFVANCPVCDDQHVYHIGPQVQWWKTKPPSAEAKKASGEQPTPAPWS